jgi:hypothetical protein
VNHARSATGVQDAARERDLIIEGRSSRLRWKNGSEPAAPLGSRLIVQPTFDEVGDLAGQVTEESNHCAKSRVGHVLAPVCARRASIERNGHG